MSIVRKIAISAADAQSLLANFRVVLADDEQAIHDAVEGETDLLQTFDAAIARLAEIESLADGIGDLQRKLKDRKSRLEAQADTIRAAMQHAMEVASIRKHEAPAGTASLRNVAPTLRIIEESEIPSRFFEPQPPKLDKKALLDALKTASVEKTSIPGAELSNGGVTVSIKLG